MKKTSTVLVSAVLFGQAFVWDAQAARTLHVGADKEYKSPSQAINAAQAGDTILIAEGVWSNDTVYCPKTPNVTIRGAGIGKTVIDGTAFNAPSSAQGGPHLAGWKGLWVVTGTGWTIEGVTFRNAHVPADAGANGAGLRYEADGDVTIRNCSFTDCQNGILCGRLPNATMTIENCVFRANGNHADRWGGDEGYTHNLYIGEIKELVFRNSVSDHAWRGHDLKSRAHKTTIEDSIFDDGHDGRSSYLVNCPNGGVITIRGCRFVQSETASNRVMISIGEEGPYPHTTLTESDNTFKDYRNGRVWNLAFPFGFAVTLTSNGCSAASAAARM